MVRPDSASEFPRLLDRVRAGSEGAARRLFELYQRSVLQAVRRRLPRRLRSKYDSTDLTQEVWAELFASGLDHTACQSPAGFARFVQHLADWRAKNLLRKRLGAGKGNVDREHTLGSSTVRGEVLGAAHGGPSPSEAAADAEQWQRLLHSQSPRHQQILVLLRQGDSYEEVARKLGIHPRTIRRLIYRLARVARL